MPVPSKWKTPTSGLKQSGIMQLLLKTEHLRKGSFLILDSPETNLHRELQLKLSKLIIQLIKELNITVFINLNVLYDNLGNPYDEIRIENALKGIE